MMCIFFFPYLLKNKLKQSYHTRVSTDMGSHKETLFQRNTLNTQLPSKFIYLENFFLFSVKKAYFVVKKNSPEI